MLQHVGVVLLANMDVEIEFVYLEYDNLGTARQGDCVQFERDRRVAVARKGRCDLIEVRPLREQRGSRPGRIFAIGRR